MVVKQIKAWIFRLGFGSEVSEVLPLSGPFPAPFPFILGSGEVSSQAKPQPGKKLQDRENHRSYSEHANHLLVFN